MARGEGAQMHVVLDLDRGLRCESDDLEGRALTLERLPGAHHPAERGLDLGVADAAADGNPRTSAGGVRHVGLAADLLEVALAEPVRQAAEMVHVRMAQRDRRHAQHRAGALSDVEREVELRDLDDGLLAGDADSLHAVRREIQEAELALSGRGAWKHVLDSFGGAFAPDRVSTSESIGGRHPGRPMSGCMPPRDVCSVPNRSKASDPDRGSGR